MKEMQKILDELLDKLFNENEYEEEDGKIYDEFEYYKQLYGIGVIVGGVKYENKELELTIEKEILKTPFDFKNESHCVKFLSLSRIFLREFHKIKNKYKEVFDIGYFKNHKELIDFFNKNDYIYFGVSYIIKDKAYLNINSANPNLGFFYLEKSLLNDRNLDDLQIIFKDKLEAYLNGAVYKLYIESYEDDIEPDFYSFLCFGLNDVLRTLKRELIDNNIRYVDESEDLE